MPHYLLYNSQYLEEQELKLSYNNRSLQYNDGFFDTLIYTQNRVRFLFDHLDRMKKAIQALNLNYPEVLKNAEKFSDAIRLLIQKNNIAAEAIRVKVNIWRKAGGLFTPESNEAEVLISVQAQNSFSPSIKLAGFYADLPNRFTPFSFFKGPYALHYVQASIAKKRSGFDEIVLLDEKKNISECLASNIFWIKNNQLFTPALETGCIAGIMRLNILRAAQMLRIEVQEGFFSQSDLLAADFIFTSNVTALRPVLSIYDQQFAPQHSLLPQLEKLVFA